MEPRVVPFSARLDRAQVGVCCCRVLPSQAVSGCDLSPQGSWPQRIASVVTRGIALVRTALLWLRGIRFKSANWAAFTCSPSLRRSPMQAHVILKDLMCLVSFPIFGQVASDWSWTAAERACRQQCRVVLQAWSPRSLCRLASCNESYGCFSLWHLQVQTRLRRTCSGSADASWPRQFKEAAFPPWTSSTVSRALRRSTNALWIT